MHEFWQTLILTLLAAALWAITTNQLLRVEDMVNRLQGVKGAVSEHVERVRDPGG